MEDTAFYRYGVLLSRNEVGAEPGIFSMGVEDFHRSNLLRAQAFPHAMLATATHDHKRGEDTRARLAVLSAVAEDWVAAVRRWKQEHKTLLIALDSTDRVHVEAGVHHEPQWVPGAPDELMLYQTIVGAWPMDMLDIHQLDRRKLQAFAERIAAWQEKALREAKHHSSWTLPNQHYEEICRKFVFHLLDPDSNLDFLGEVIAWVCRITPAATANSLAQTLLRLTSPGVPDLYQGTEFWDFSLVDPDNRRPVDYAARRAVLAEPPLERQWSERPPAQIKLHLIRRLLTLRREYPALFAAGEYIPLETTGPHADKLLAFMRRHREAGQENWLLVAVTLLRGRELAESGFHGLDWWGTDVLLPEECEGEWDDVLDGQVKSSESDGCVVLPARTLLGDMPIAVLKRSLVIEGQGRAPGNV